MKRTNPWPRLRRLAGAAMALACLAAPVRAQERPGDADLCYKSVSTAEVTIPDVVAACSRVIATPGKAGDVLANAHNNRGAIYLHGGRIGPAVEHHPLFPERVNVTLAAAPARDHIVIRTWERGAGLTKACGSAACAAAVAAARLARTDRKVTVTLPGGDLAIEWREADDHVLMTGPAEYEYDGRFDAALPADAGAA